MATIEVNVPAGVDTAAARRIVDRVLAHQARAGRLGDALARESSSVGPGALAQVGRIDRAWRDVEATYGLYTGEQVARLTTAKSVRSHVHNLRRRHGLLGVRRGGSLRYPGFQFTQGNPRTVRADWQGLCAPLTAAGWTEDEVLLWFASPTGLLSGQRAADLLDADPHRVQAAVAHAAAGTPG